MERLPEIERIIHAARDYQGQAALNEDTLFRQACAWEETLRHIPTESLWECYQHAQKTRQNAGSILNPQNLLQAHREMMQQGRAVTLAPERIASDVHCPHCHGIGYVLKTESRRRDILADDAAAMHYTVAARCDCYDGMYPAPNHAERVGKMLRWLAARYSGEMPNPDKQQIAAERLLEAGWSSQEILCCWEDLTSERRQPVEWVTVWRYIGIRYARQCLADTFAHSLERKAEAEQKAAEMMAIAARPVTLEEYRKERQRRENAKETAFTERQQEQNDREEGYL